MRGAPFGWEDAIHALEAEFHTVTIDQMACARAGQGVDETALHQVDLHVGVDAAEGIGVPVLAVRWELAVRIVETDQLIDGGWGEVVCLESMGERGESVAPWRSVGSVEEMLVAALADHETDIAGD